MQVGRMASIHSLANAKEHNGKRVVLKKFNADAGRWEVEICSDSQILRVRSENLTSISVVDDEAVAVEIPPPWYDEDVPPEFSASAIFDDCVKARLSSIDRDEADIDNPTCIAEGAPEIGTMLHMAVSMMDLPFIRAVLRRGADINAKGVQGTALQQTLYAIGSRGAIETNRQQSRSRVTIAAFLLSVGADPNRIFPDGTHPANSMSPILIAAAIPDTQVAKQTCELLLAHGANPDAKYNGKTILKMSPSPAARLGLKALLTRYKGCVPPARLCPCGSEREFAVCHGAEGGVVLHARAHCPCNGPKAKRLGKCCGKIGEVYK